MSTNLNLYRAALRFAWVALLAPGTGPAAPAPALRIDTMQHLTSAALVAGVVEHNAGLAARREAAVAAQHRIGPAGALDDPALFYAFAPGTINGLERPAGPDRGLNQRIEISQSFPWPGTRDLRKDAARFEADAAVEDIHATRLRLIALARTSHAQWYYIHAALDVNSADLALLEELRSVAEFRYSAGIAGQQDVLQAEVRIQELRRQRLDMVRISKQVAAQINALLNRAPGASVPPPAALPPPTASPDIHLLQNMAIGHHPELIALERRIEANEAREGLATKAFRPDFRIFAGYNSLWDEDEKRLVTGVGINIPIGRDKRHAALAEAEAVTRRYRREADERRADLLGELQQSHAALEQAVATYRLYEEELTPRTRENLSAARAEYGSGSGSFLNVITAEQQTLDARLGSERARADYYIAAAELERWVGGDLPAAPGIRPAQHWEGTP